MSFIRNVITANSGNECAPEYILWAGYAALSLACGRRYFLETDHFTVDPRLYVMLVGPAGNRKTFARDFMVKIISKAIPDIILSANCESHQAIIQFMDQEDNVRHFINWKGEPDQERPYGLFVSELMNYIKIDPTGFTSFLTDLRDTKDVYKYRIKGQDGVGVLQEMHFPYFVMLACTAPDWLTKQIKGEEFCGGFGRRTIFVCNDNDTRMKPHKSDVAKKAEEDAIQALRDIHSKAGKFTLSPEADDFFWNKWYTNKQAHKLSEDKFMRSWGRSKHIQLLCVAMLTCLSEDPLGANKYVISKEHIEFSLALLNQVEGNISMITDKMGKSEVVQAHETVLTTLKAANGYMLAKQLRLMTMKEFKNTQEQFTVLEFMIRNEQIYKVTQNGKEYFALPDRVQKTEAPKPQPPTTTDPAT